jgi:hypothetical protein
VLVTIVGVLLLGSLTKTPDVAPDARPVEAVIDGEAIFKMTPREPAEVQADDQDAKPAKGAKTAVPRTAAKPKPPAVTAAAAPPRPASEAPAPLPLVLTPPPPQATAEAAPASDNTVMGKLRSATAAVQQMPQRAARSVAGWFSESAPPRPPASVPVRDFRASIVLQ